MADAHYGGYTRFELELECLANPLYLNDLATKKFFDDPQFVEYLKYLQYFAEPKYIKFLSYPGPTLRALELLQQERFRKDILIPETCMKLAEEGFQVAFGYFLDILRYPKYLEMAATYTGSCKCNAIQIEMQGEPDVVALCHCRNCRKSTSSTYSTNAVFSRSAFTVVSGEPKVYQATGGSGNPAYVKFCGNCSSTMWTESPLKTDIVIVKVGILDGDAIEKLAPKVETFTSRRPGWVKGVDGAGQLENGYQAPPSN